MIPGLHSAGEGRRSLTYSLVQNDVDIFVDMGSPTVIVDFDVYVSVGVIIGGTSYSGGAPGDPGPGEPSMDFRGFVAGSKATLYIDGRIQGRGGKGGDGMRGSLGHGPPPNTTAFDGGGGGGGVGSLVGVGGIASPDGTNGVTSGTASGSEGAGGASDLLNLREVLFSNYWGFNGGDAITADASISLLIHNFYGEIWGGGGGGPGGIHTSGHLDLPGGPGADAGVAALGYEAYLLDCTGGKAGYAIRSPGSVIFVSGGSDPNVKGTVG